MNKMRQALIVGTSALLLVAVGCGSGSGPASQGAAKPPASSSSSATAAPAGTAPGASATPLPLLGSVKSADGAARVDVPVGSLPAGMRVEDIKVAAVDPASLPVTFPDGPALAAYKLEPDGTKFTTPVTFSVTVPSKDAFLPTIVMVSGNEVSAALDIEVKFDAEAETLTASTKLDHFSYWTMAREAFFTVSIENINDQIVGQKFAVSAHVGVTAEQYHQVAVRNAFETLSGADEHALVKLAGSPWLVDHFDVIRGPVVQVDIPTPLAKKLTTPSSVGSYYFAIFDCTSVGLAQIGYTAALFVPTTWEWVVLYGAAITQGTHVAEYKISVRNKPFQCKASLPTVTPTSYVSPSQNRRPVVSPIQAVLESGNKTRYSVAVSDPNGDILTALWEGRDCGAPQTYGPKTDRLEAQGGFEMVWAHTVVYCHKETFRTPEPHPDHANIVIKVTISDASSLTDASLKRFHWQVICTYSGVGTGTGPACSAPVNVEK